MGVLAAIVGDHPQSDVVRQHEERLAAEKAELCRVATKNFEMLSGPGAVKRRDEYGQDHTLTEEEKSAERDRAKAGMDLNCPPGK